ncbi:uncharacterized protein LOC135684734 [Rhopilema esculentum]|uniref:uncharacterized protein LOC135684734 n=1 Tax=Rhopilema esculentum TaxID=499914 RepID=UPI0031E27350
MLNTEGRVALFTHQHDANSQTESLRIYLTRNARHLKLSLIVYLLPWLLILHKTGLTFAQTTLSEKSNLTHNACTESNSSSDFKINLTFSSTFFKIDARICEDVNWTEVLRLDNHTAVEFEIGCEDFLIAVAKLKAVSYLAEIWASVLGRFDCKLPYSMDRNCTNCLVSYKRWLCMVTFYDGSLKPCLEICNDVYRSCPSFEPEDSYRGYSVFECPREGDKYSSYGPKTNCKSAPSLAKQKK